MLFYPKRPAVRAKIALPGIPNVRAGGRGLVDLLLAAIGHLLFNSLCFEADEVYAGSSVPGGSMDVVKGSVIARSGDSVTLRSAILVRTDGTVVFNDNVTLTLGASTKVSKELAIGTHTIDEISVGSVLPHLAL